MKVSLLLPSLIVFSALATSCNEAQRLRYKDDPRRTPLTNAISGRDLGRVQALIAQHADLNEEDSLGEVQMQFAAQSQTPAIVAPLISAGANVNGKGLWGPSPL